MAQRPEAVLNTLQEVKRERDSASEDCDSASEDCGSSAELDLPSTKSTRTCTGALRGLSKASKVVSQLVAAPSNRRGECSRTDSTHTCQGHR